MFSFVISKDLVCEILKIKSLNALIISLKLFEEINVSFMNYLIF